MRNLRLTLAYDGTPYHGWQTQPGVPTVQGRLESVLRNILDESVSTHGSGRTDAGVHAEGQVAHFHTKNSIQLPTLLAGLNALLPPEIRVTGVEEVPMEFDARRSALSKTYEYHIWRTPIVPPNRYRYVYPFSRPLDTDAIDQATLGLKGRHDFTSFCAASTVIEDHVREIYQLTWIRDSNEWVLRVCANGFLRYMVRTIVGTLIEIGLHRMDPPAIDTIIGAKNRQIAGPTAPPQGLHLVSVEY